MSPAPDAPFVRFSRDSRGYEHVYLVHAPGGRGGRSRVLYWFRTPPGVKVGRQPFDPTLQKALEARYPELHFDWRSILEAQAPPPPEIEHWRERRRAEKATKLARQAAAKEEEPGAPATSDAAAEESVGEPEASIAGGKVTAAPDGSPTTVPGVESQRRRRRRRRGGRGRRDTAGAMAASVVASQDGNPAQSGSGPTEPVAPGGPSNQFPEAASEFVESSESEPADPTS